MNDNIAWLRITTRNPRDLIALVKAGIILRVQTGATIEDEIVLELFTSRDLGGAGAIVDASGQYPIERPPKLEIVS